MNVWFIIGIASLAWSGIELVTGEAWLHRAIRRSVEPTFYWVTVLFWFGLGAWCIAPWLLA